MRNWLIVAGLLVVFLREGTLAQPAGKESGSLEALTVAQLKNLISKDSGSVVLLNIWATWCKPCKDEMPRLLQLKKKYQSAPFDLILVSADDIDQIDSVIKPMLSELGVGFPTYIIHDSTDDAFINGMNSDWNGALPTSFLYSKQGNLVDMMVGERTLSQFEKAIAPLIKVPDN